MTMQGGSQISEDQISENVFDGTAGDSSSTATTTYALNITAGLTTVSKGVCLYSGKINSFRQL